MTDAHNHLQDIRFDGIRAEVIETMRQAGISRSIVNGTRPSDWGTTLFVSFRPCIYQ